MSSPSCSIIIPTYNRLAYLRRAIASVQAQTFSDWELLVVDDGSSDKSLEIVAELEKRDRRVRALQNSGPRGPAAARNVGIREARSRYVAFLDSDDIWEPEKLQSFMGAAASRPDAVLIGSDYKIFDGATNETKTMRDVVYKTMLPWWEKYALTATLIPCADLRRDSSMLADSETILSMTIGGFLWIQTSSVLLQRQKALELGGFDESLLRTEDIDLWLRLNGSGRFVFVDEELATYDATGRDEAVGARYEGQEQARLHTEYSEWASHLALLERIGDRYVLSAEQRVLLKARLSFFHKKCAAAAWRAGQRRVWLSHLSAGSRWAFVRRAGQTIQDRYSRSRV